WLWRRDHQYRRRSILWLARALSLPHADARSGQVRAAMPEQPRPAAAQGRRHHLGSAQDPGRLGQPAARPGPGALTHETAPMDTGGCMNRTEAQIIVVGSGMNSLVCA